ncbi:von Willebrand factor A domain-containing protein 3A [Scyliorhinus canicula]|uniref:von Willebrand factor A domain-containing protein 3A n=1 Tax=Scyliorhinus canicula TaxID=7830 RepID=UPI0018F43083|nr:von Willebrand factor A domain-containing protein 3A [Scyliorhinus canicula]XP_038676655.1 von Willebrand factor A domain-containing protein 3A [Scyliorhinus canicula]
MNQRIGNMADILANEQFLQSELAQPAKAPWRRREPWQDVAITDLEPDDGLLVTHVNQTSGLLSTEGKWVLANDNQTSEEWLTNHSLEHQKLTLHHLLAHSRIITNKDETDIKHLQLRLDIIDKFESRIHEMTDFYHQRMEWLREGSRKMFGLVKGSRVGLLIDSSAANCGLGRLQEFQTALLCLLDEQLCHRKQFYFLSFGSDPSALWETPRNVNIRTLDEARQWVQDLQPSGSCNLLKAVKRIAKVRKLNALLIILGTCPDQTAECLVDYMQQCMLGRHLPIQAVAYDCSHHMTHTTLRALAEVSGGRYHSYSTGCQNQMCWSNDIESLMKELQRASDMLEKIQELRVGLMGDTLNEVMEEISTEVAKIPPDRFLPQPPNHDRPLCIETSSFLPKTSADWLRKNGLKAQKLSLYQVLAPNAFSPLEEFVPILRKTVSSTLHGKAMMQLEWHDGTVKNVHVDPPLLYEYQKRLGQAMSKFEHRADWLSTSSRRIWGNICEKRVQVFVDISLYNSLHIIHIQHSLRLLLEQQMSNKESFNLTAFGSEVKQYQPRMVPVTPEKLQAAWRWALALQCKGSRNFLGALKAVIENDLSEQCDSCGLYLLTSGVPDQGMDAVCSYVAEICGGRDLQLHICLFSIGNIELSGTVPARYATPRQTACALRELAQSGRGRFHWFQEAGIIESDDIRLILTEMEKAANYSQKCAVLVESLRKRSVKQSPTPPDSEDSLKMLVKREIRCPQKLLIPKPTALTLARMQAREESGEENGSGVRALMWRPSSGKAVIPPAHPDKKWIRSSVENCVKQNKMAKVSKSMFYTEVGNKVGAVYQKYPKVKSVRKTIPFVYLPKEEEISSTSVWLQKFGIKKLRLDLHKLVSGLDCEHKKRLVKTLRKRVSAKYCATFPRVEINGAVKHLQLHLHELEEYIEQVERVLCRYLQRLQWLLSGSRRLFGTILEKRVCILLDTSGSTNSYLPALRKELTSLIWEQLRKNNHSFNLVCFAERVDTWRDCLMEATDETCHEAVQWASGAIAHGNTCTLEALQKAFQFADVQGIYLLTDGKPDTSCSLILKETQRLNQGRGVKIHTISFNCADRTANEFLKKLAGQTGGRFHRCHGDVDGQLAAHKMRAGGFSDEDNPNLPAFEGSDLKRLSGEINKARRFLTQAKSFRHLLLEKQIKPDRTDSGT